VPDGHHSPSPPSGSTRGATPATPERRPAGALLRGFRASRSRHRGRLLRPRRCVPLTPTTPAVQHTREGAHAVIDVLKALVERTGGTLHLAEVGALEVDADTGVAQIHLTGRFAGGPVAIEALELSTFRTTRRARPSPPPSASYHRCSGCAPRMVSELSAVGDPRAQSTSGAGEAVGQDRAPDSHPAGSMWMCWGRSIWPLRPGCRLEGSSRKLPRSLACQIRRHRGACSR